MQALAKDTIYRLYNLAKRKDSFSRKRNCTKTFLSNLKVIYKHFWKSSSWKVNGTRTPRLKTEVLSDNQIFPGEI